MSSFFLIFLSLVSYIFFILFYFRASNCYFELTVVMEQLDNKKHYILLFPIQSNGCSLPSNFNKKSIKKNL